MSLKFTSGCAKKFGKFPDSDNLQTKYQWIRWRGAMQILFYREILRYADTTKQCVATIRNLPVDLSHMGSRAHLFAARHSKM